MANTHPTWLTILAILMGPVTALMISRVLDWIREKDKRRKQLFFTLIGTRAMFHSPQHVEALNSIDVVFDQKDDKAIRDQWAHVLQHLEVDETTPGWSETLDTRRVDLYQAIAKRLGYAFSAEYIKKGIYFPKYHYNFFRNQDTIYEGLAKALAEGTLRVRLEEPEPVVEPPEARIGLYAVRPPLG